ncbi:MAG: M28 family metallopeptidase [Planctomycetota bacterium]
MAADKPALDAVDPQIVEMVRAVSAQRLEADVRTLVGFGTRHTLSETQSQTRGIGAARRWIKEQFDRIAAETGGRLQVEFEAYSQQPDGRRITRPVEIVNIVATLPGRSAAAKDRVFLVSGHYDSICSDPKDAECDAPGADDDASGTAAVLEAARITTRHEFDATIVFVAVAGEEQGLYGSKHLAGKYGEAGVNVAGMITNDIVGNATSADGTVDRSRLRVFSEGVPEIETPEQAKIRLSTGSENDSPARQLARYTRRMCDVYLDDFEVVLIFRRDRFGRGGDHTAFAKAGYPAVRLTEMHEDYRHQHQVVRMEDGIQYGDLPRFVDFDYLAQVTRVNVATLASAARAPARPANPRIMTASPTRDTTLRWRANTEPDLAGYEVVWRDTTAPDWEHSRFVGNTTQFTVDLSKDNYAFGVRAVDRDGHRSVVAYPLPSK